MPFTFETLHAKAAGRTLILRGKLLDGAFFGPENVVLRSARGEAFVSSVQSHEIERPIGWPVLPEHTSTVLVLVVGAPPDGFDVWRVEGVGITDSDAPRVDITEVLAEPAFWVTQVIIHCQPQDTDEPGLEWFGIDAETANAWYGARIEAHLRSGVWPFIRADLPDGRYIELEMACGAEYQDRIWIGHIPEDERTMLGYHSGHFSLPALRLAEAEWLANATSHAASGLIWLAAAYVDRTKRPIELADRLALNVPGLRPESRRAYADALLAGLVVDDVTWTQDSTLGWINNSMYSQRNPDSRLSSLSKGGFRHIQSFFRDVCNATE